MNSLLAFCLVVSSPAAARVWSPITPNKQEQGNQQVIVKEGHRTIVVECEPDHVHGHPNTIVSISPEQHHVHTPESIDAKAAGGISSTVNAKEYIKESSSFLPNVGHDQGLSQSSRNAERAETQVTPKELICDALGKCKHKIATAMGKAKDMVSETTHEAIDKTKEMKHKAKETELLFCFCWRAQLVVFQHEHEVGEAMAHAFDKARETISKKAHEVGEHGKENVEDVVDKDKVEMAKEEVVEKAKEAKETADKLKKETKKELRGLVGRGRDVGRGALRYAKSTEARRSVMFVFNLLGLATAYGMCVWITFISSYILAGAMPKQQFGMMQSKIYPMYFSAMAASIGAALVGFMLGNTKSLFLSKAEMFQGYFLLASLLMVFANLLYLEMRATKVMFERMKMEKEEGRVTEELIAEPSRPSQLQQDANPAVSTTTSASAVPAAASPEGAKLEVIRIQIVRLNGRLKKLNTYSSFLNILTLMALGWHLVYLSQRLHLSSC
ncbi:hypothetical protein CIPAW_08G002400 [Carya illinoinensis]|uniref:TMEM205-like domain-containing protein n=1 Tax=Carya illinoinensis TaxID=32201 RepID=A0A8T1PH21_CARIL|nr:hypothetical protein CIPAW_08G002400 [Carya illinoinensis]